MLGSQPKQSKLKVTVRPWRSSRPRVDCGRGREKVTQIDNQSLSHGLVHSDAIQNIAGNVKCESEMSNLLHSEFSRSTQLLNGSVNFADIKNSMLRRCSFISERVSFRAITRAQIHFVKQSIHQSHSSQKVLCLLTF
jgi:hypothetical protein